MRRIIFTILAVVAICQFSIAQVGTWKEYMAYHEIQDVKRGGNTLYVLASNNLYTYNENDNSIQTYDKVNGLSDCNINKIEWNNNVKKLLIIYDDYNFDILDESGNVTNLSDYYNASITGNKAINDIYMSGRFAYLSTSFGIVKVDLRDNEISDTYNLKFYVNYCYIDGDYIYAASQAVSSYGLYRASLTSNLLDPSLWTKVGNVTPKTYTVDADLLAEAQQHIPDGPKYNHFAFLKFYNGKLYTSGGYGAPSRPGTIQVLDGDNWTIYEDGTDITSKTGRRNYIDVYCLDIDPKDEKHVFAGSRNGLYEFRNGILEHFYNSDNSPICSALDTVAYHDTYKEYEIVRSVKFDSDGNLWIFNNQAKNSLMKYDGSQWTLYNKGVWMTYSMESENIPVENGNSITGGKDLMFDSRGLLWFVNNSWTLPSAYIYQISTDAAVRYTTFVNEDGTTMSIGGGVSCVAEDRDNNIWLGSNIGPMYIQSEDVGKADGEFYVQQHKVPRDDGTDLADYLLSNVDITCIAVDGGNRKWFGTNNNGVYLISADNNTEIHHFLPTNSGLLSENVESIAINPTTGEVFFGTQSGLCSYMSDATETVDKMDKDVTYAYPNPVKPGYTGPITITGLTYNADVKIVTSNGVLVAEGRSTGGSFVWDGTDLKGKRVASGIYMVQTATENGDKGTVCKIAVVN